MPNWATSRDDALYNSMIDRMMSAMYMPQMCLSGGFITFAMSVTGLGVVSPAGAFVASGALFASGSGTDIVSFASIDDCVLCLGVE